MADQDFSFQPCTEQGGWLSTGLGSVTQNKVEMEWKHGENKRPGIIVTVGGRATARRDERPDRIQGKRTDS